MTKQILKEQINVFFNRTDVPSVLPEFLKNERVFTWLREITGSDRCI